MSLVDQVLIPGLDALVHQNILYVLLSDGGRTLRTSAGEVVDHGTHHAVWVHSMVVHEAPVLNGDDGFFHDWCDLLGRDQHAAFGKELRKHASVRVQHPRTLGRLRHLQFGGHLVKGFRQSADRGTRRTHRGNCKART